MFDKQKKGFLQKRIKISNIFWLIIISLIISISASAQSKSYPYDIVKYDFIDYEKNKLLFFSDSSNFESFYQSLDEVIFQGEGKINILHIGGSHIQADVFSGRIRKRFQTFSPGIKGARGFVFPYRVAKTNTPLNYWVDYTGEWEACRNVERNKNCVLGLSGISVTTRDSISTIKLYKRENIKYLFYDFNKIKVFYDICDSSFKLEINNPNLVTKTEIHQNEGYTIYFFNKHIDTLELKIIKTDTLQTHFTLYGIILENDDPGIIYNSIGINGASVPSFLRCSLLQQHLKILNPDLVILSLGINDAYGRKFSPDNFILNYDSLINRIRKAKPDVPIILTTNNDSYLYRRHVNRNGEKVRKAMYYLAKKHNAAVWDLYTVMGGLNSIVIWQRLELAKRDKIHFTREGYNIIGDLFFNAMLRAYDVHLSRSPKTEVRNRK